MYVFRQNSPCKADLFYVEKKPAASVLNTDFCIKLFQPTEVS